jgi:molybdate transport system ATP-binding protein
MLDARLSTTLGAFTFDAGLAVPDRTVMVIVGESASGKTTLLRMLAGLHVPVRGRLVVDGEVWSDSETQRFVPAHLRPIGHVAQDHALFPHLTAAQNVAFGLEAQGIVAKTVRVRTGAALARLGVAALASRRPHELSGGQQQRVAIARAIVLEPKLLLMDEPLSALDATSRRTIRSELRRLLAELPCTTLYVTHSPAEALAMGERITVLENGRVSQTGTRDDLMRQPGSPYVAEFLGVNLFRGSIEAFGAGDEATARSISVPSNSSAARVTLPEGELLLAAPGTDGEATAIVNPREITLTLERPSGTARNVFVGVIEELVPEPPNGERVRVTVLSHPPLTAEVTRQAVEALGLAPGIRVFASFKASGVVVTR